MKILAITDKLPMSAKSPGNPRFFEFTRCLSAMAEVDLLLIGDEPLQTDERNIYNEMFFEKFVALKEDTIGRIFRIVFLIPSFYVGYGNFKKRRLIRDKVNKIFASKRYDLVYVDGLSTFQFIPNNLVEKAHLDLCDSISKLKFRESRSQITKRRKLAFLLEALSIYIKEFLAMMRTKSFSFISSSEIEPYKLFFSRNFISSKLLVLNQGLNNELFQYSKLRNDSKKILFFGALDYFPNEDAAIWFGNEVFPALKIRFAELELHIVGKAPSREIQKMSAQDGLFVHPNVPAMSPYLESARIIVVPLRVGAGVKNKILISALSGRPIVSTSIGLEGLEADLRDGICQADSPAEFIEQIGNILSEDPEHLENRLNDLSKKVLEIYSWEKSAKLIYDSVES